MRHKKMVLHGAILEHVLRASEVIGDSEGVQRDLEGGTIGKGVSLQSNFETLAVT